MILFCSTEPREEGVEARLLHGQSGAFFDQRPEGMHVLAFDGLDAKMVVCDVGDLHALDLGLGDSQRCPADGTLVGAFVLGPFALRTFHPPHLPRQDPRAHGHAIHGVDGVTDFVPTEETFHGLSHQRHRGAPANQQHIVDEIGG